jgi:hypothetical protein
LVEDVEAAVVAGRGADPVVRGDAERPIAAAAEILRERGHRRVEIGMRAVDAVAGGIGPGEDRGVARWRPRAGEIACVYTIDSSARASSRGCRRPHVPVAREPVGTLVSTRMTTTFGAEGLGIRAG